MWPFFWARLETPFGALFMLTLFGAFFMQTPFGALFMQTIFESFTVDRQRVRARQREKPGTIR